MATRAKIQREVERLLELPGAEWRPLPVELIARQMGIEVVLDPLDSHDDVSGFYFREGDRRVIGVNSAHAEARQRFTIAHELGHAILHDDEGLHLDGAFMLRDAKSSKATDPSEIAANRFAAELLMPEDEVREAIATGELDLNDDSAIYAKARHFGVSVQALTIRLVNLGVGFDAAAG